MNLEIRQNIQTTILALLVARKGGCTTSQLSKDYEDEVGEPIPYKEFGCVSLLNFLRTMSKVVQIEKRNGTFILKGIASDKSKHVSKLVSEQKEISHKNAAGRKSYKPSHYYPKTAPCKIYIPAEVLAAVVSLINDHPDGVNKDYIFKEVKKHMPFTNISLREMEEQLQELSHKVFIENNKIFPIQSKGTHYSSANHNGTPSSRSGSIPSDKRKCNSAVMTVAGDEDIDDISDYGDEDDFQFLPSDYTYTPPYIKSSIATSTFIKESVSRCQEQIKETKIKDNVDRMQIEQNKLYSMHNYDYNDNVEIHSEFNSNVVGEYDNYLDDKDFEVLINDRVKFRLKKLILNHPEGIWCSALPKMYLEEYKVSLNYTELGFNSVREFASYLPEIFHCIQPCNAGDFVLYDASKEVPSNEHKETQKFVNLSELHQIYSTDDVSEPIPTAVSLNTCKELIPDNVMSMGECVGYLSVTNLINGEKPYVEVYVVEVFTPSFFWIQLRNKQKTFDKFMEDLHNFYTLKHKEYAVPPVVLEKGLNCACMYNRIWHRGIIKSVSHDLQVTVMFYDYGTLKTYPPNAIYYLHRAFSALSAQAIPCGLFNTRPRKGSKWSQNATHCFALRTSQIPLIATVASVSVEENSMMITLTDTLEEEDVHINDWLVDQKLAEHGKMVCMKTRNFPFRWRLECSNRNKQNLKSKVSKMNALTEGGTSISTENYSNNEVALHGSNLHVNSLPKNAVYKSSDDVNLILSGEIKNVVQSPKSGSSGSSFTPETCKSTKNFIGKLQKKLNSFEKVVQFKPELYISEGDNNTNKEFKDNVESNEHSSTSSTLSRATKGKLNDNNSSTKISLNNNKGVNRTSNKTSDILKEYANIPKVYATHFDIRNSDDEWEVLGNSESHADACYNQHEFKTIDWPVLQDSSSQRTEYIPQLSPNKVALKSTPKVYDDVPLPESSFLEMCRNSKHFAARDEDIQWIPNGNINKKQDASPLILRNIKKIAGADMKNVIVEIPQKTLKMLSGEKRATEHSKSFTNASKSTNESQSTGLVTGISNSMSDNNNLNVNAKRLESNCDNTVRQVENNYLHMKAVTSKRKLLQKMSEIRNASNSSYDADSDDESVSEKSTSSVRDVNDIKSEFEINEYNGDGSLLSDDTNKTSLNVKSPEPEKSVLTKCSILEEEPMLGEQQVLPEHLITAEKRVSTGLNQPVLTQKQALIELDKLLERYELDVEIEEKTDTASFEMSLEKDQLEIQQGNELSSLKNSNKQEEMEDSVLGSMKIEQSLVNGQLKVVDSVPLKQSPLIETRNPQSNIPVFNDIDMESDEEEWDTHIPLTEAYKLLNNYCSFNNAQNEVDCNIEPKVVEVHDDNFPDNADVVHSYKNEEDKLVEVTHSENAFTADTEHARLDTTLKLLPWKVQGKAKTLVGLLDKVKRLRTDK